MLLLEAQGRAATAAAAAGDLFPGQSQRSAGPTASRQREEPPSLYQAHLLIRPRGGREVEERGGGS